MALLRALLPRAEREEVLADVELEYGEMAAARGEAIASRWLWQQALRSAPALLRWTSWRGLTGSNHPRTTIGPEGQC